MAITVLSNVSVDQAAYNLAMDYTLRANNYFDAVATVKPTMQAMPGSTVKFTITTDLALASTSINESTDISAVAMADSQVTVTLAEYGNAVQTSALVRGTSFVVPYDAVVANVIGYNAAASIDIVARTALAGGTNVLYANGKASRGALLVTDILGTVSSTAAGSNAVRQSVSALRRNNVGTFGGGYVGYIHPDVSYDLRSETGAAAWRDPHVYSQPQDIWNAEIGMYEGTRWIEAPRTPVVADAGSSPATTDVYQTIIVGQQALAKAYSYTDGNGAQPQIVPGPVTDLLRRFVPLGWYWLGGYARYREAAIRRIESASSIGRNASSGTNDSADSTINGN